MADPVTAEAVLGRGSERGCFVSITVTCQYQRRFAALVSSGHLHHESIRYTNWFQKRLFSASLREHNTITAVIDPLL